MLQKGTVPTPENFRKFRKLYILFLELLLFNRDLPALVMTLPPEQKFLQKHI